MQLEVNEFQTKSVKLISKSPLNEQTQTQMHVTKKESICITNCCTKQNQKLRWNTVEEKKQIL